MMISEIEFKQLSLNWASLNSYLISVLTENRPVYVINQLLCPIELRVSIHIENNDSILVHI